MDRSSSCAVEAKIAICHSDVPYSMLSEEVEHSGDGRISVLGHVGENRAVESVVEYLKLGFGTADRSHRVEHPFVLLTAHVRITVGHHQ